MINLSKLAALAKATPKELAQSTSADALAQEKLTRRAALRRIGMTGSMTVLGVLSIDELARVAAKKLDEHEMTRGLAKDFKDAGVAMAAPVPPSPNEIWDADQKCVQNNPDRTSSAYWLCMGNEIGVDIFNANFESIWCTINDPRGNNGKCPGFPTHLPCEAANPVLLVAQSCCDAKFAKCIINHANAGEAAAAACEHSHTHCYERADGINDPFGDG